jgi:hypothetical protein
VAKQDWSIGQEVSLGGRRYVVKDHLPAKEPGQAARRVLSPVGDPSRVYEYTPFRGLELKSGELVRPRRKRVRKHRGTVAAQVPSAPVTAIKPKGRLVARLARFFGWRKAPADQTITRAPGAAIRGKGATHAKG